MSETSQPDAPEARARRDVIALLKQAVPDGVTDGPGPVGDACAYVSRDRILDALKVLKADLGFDALMDLTCVDYPDRQPRFEVIYNLYSLATNERAFLKVPADDSEPGLPSATPLFAAADWFEREVYDMFGVRFSGHPNLKRILMYDAFVGHPLRKDYDARHRQHIVQPTSDPTAH
jgi:NADH-quinone oxidoreductase subunit C